MLDGRIETQGTVKELQAQGVLKEIKHDAAVETHKEEIVVAKSTSVDVEESPDTTEVSKKPRKLVKDEHREIGPVKWSIYKSYLRASSVSFPAVSLENSDLTLLFYSSYQIWVILVILVVINQFWGITEKLWIKVFDFISLFLDVNLIDHRSDLG